MRILRPCRGAKRLKTSDPQRETLQTIVSPSGQSGSLTQIDRLGTSFVTWSRHFKAHLNAPADALLRLVVGGAAAESQWLRHLRQGVLLLMMPNRSLHQAPRELMGRILWLHHVPPSTANCCAGFWSAPKKSQQQLCHTLKGLQNSLVRIQSDVSCNRLGQHL